MKRHYISWLLAVALTGGVAACNKPSEKKCQEAVRNILELTGAGDTPGAGPDERGFVRSCRANATKDSVDCMIAAKTLDQLQQCEGEFAQRADKRTEETKADTPEKEHEDK